MRIGFIFSLIATSIIAQFSRAKETIKVDVCVYGGTSSGVIAAATVAKAGKSVILIEQGRYLGGLSSGGLGETDIGNKMVIGGLSRDFYQRIGKMYRQPEAWKFAPSIAEKVFHDIVDENHVRVLLEHRIVGATKNGAHLMSIVVEHAPADDYNAQAAQGTGETVTIEAKEFIDAGYEGDLMAQAKVSFTVGREAVGQYDESLNGICAQTPKHQFPKDIQVDPFIKPGDPASGLIPLVKEMDGGKPGDGDKRMQAYNFRVCVTNDKTNQTPFTPPPGYDAANYELLIRYIAAMNAAGKPMTQATFFKWDIMPGNKTDINNNGAISTDFIGQSWAYPEADYAARGQILHAHRDYVQGFFYFMATDPRSPQKVRDFLSHWGPCKDEFKDTGGWPHQMYVREARRMVSDYVVTQKICKHEETAADSIGMAAYNMDSHNCNRIVKNGAVINEGDVQVAPSGPYPIAYRAIVPKAAECDNLLVPVCLSATHIAYGSIRMEPVFMVLGQSSALAACQAIDDGQPLQRIDVAKLQKTLLEVGQVLAYTAPMKKK
jgi:hypothetical protein